MFSSNMFIIYTNSYRLFRVFNSELILGILVLLAAVTGILGLFLPFRVLNYEAISFCALIVLYLLINRFLCYRPGEGFFRLRKLH
jgi:hypothetical protein